MPNLPKPAFFVNASDPIYKSGDPKQAGEKGEAVNIDKNVSAFAVFISIFSIK